MVLSRFMSPFVIHLGLRRHRENGRVAGAQARDESDVNAGGKHVVVPDVVTAGAARTPA